MMSIYQLHLAKEALGYFEVADEFSPSAVHDFINPIATLRALRTVKLKDKTILMLLMTTVRLPLTAISQRVRG